ncbi:hypothetical protein XI25_04685 [Paenibacillus sp. DMB20]|nr:hypothetical protein XI25_04685 [Paenibacillus sp. DMB20]
MQSVRDVFKFEWLQLRRSPIWCSLPFMHIILWVLLIIRYEIGASGQGTRDYYFYEQWLILMPVVMLLTGLYANYMLYRERCNGMDVLLRSWPRHGSSLVIGKWQLVQMYGLAFTFPLVFAQTVWLAMSGYPQEMVLLYAIYTGVQTGAAVFTFSSLGMCLGGLVRNKFSFLLLSCLWIIPVLVQLTSKTETPPLHVFWRWFAPYDLTRFRYNPVLDSYGLWGVEWTVIHQAAVLLSGVFFPRFSVHKNISSSVWKERIIHCKILLCFGAVFGDRLRMDKLSRVLAKGKPLYYGWYKQ